MSLEAFAVPTGVVAPRELGDKAKRLPVAGVQRIAAAMSAALGPALPQAPGG